MRWRDYHKLEQPKREPDLRPATFNEMHRANGTYILELDHRPRKDYDPAEVESDFNRDEPPATQVLPARCGLMSLEQHYARRKSD